MKADNPEVKTNRDLAALVGKTEQWVGQMLKLLSLPEELKEEIKSSDRIIPYESVLQIARVEDKETQRALLKDALSGASVREIREQAKSAKAQPNKAGKGRAKSTQKIPTSKGLVVIHCEKKTAKKDDYVAAFSKSYR